MFGEIGVGTWPSRRFLCATPVSSGVTRIANGQLESVLDQAETVTRTAKGLVAGRDHSDLTTSLESASWSVAQCLDHLAQTTNAFIPAISSAIARAPRLTRNRALRTGALARLFIRNLEPPYRLRFKVLAPLVPRRHDFDSCLERIRRVPDFTCDNHKIRRSSCPR